MADERFALLRVWSICSIRLDRVVSLAKAISRKASQNASSRCTLVRRPEIVTVLLVIGDAASLAPAPARAATFPPFPHLFPSERGGPMTPKSFHTLISRLGERAGMAFPNPSSHAAPCLRLRTGERGTRHASHPSVDGAPQYSAHSPLYELAADRLGLLAVALSAPVRQSTR